MIGYHALPRIPRHALSSLLLLALALPSPAMAQVSTAPVFPGEEWEYVPRRDLAAYGWDTDGLQGAFAFLRDSSNATGLVVVDRGRIVFDFGDVEELSYIASARKSILAMLYGDWVEKGIIDLETTIGELGHRRKRLDHYVRRLPAGKPGDGSRRACDGELQLDQ
ncbi:MAG: hypothetical protein EXQ50_10275 [Acidobacteria bacterium]|nr:hypothetical protein [Acidobacteriota bacterium]